MDRKEELYPKTRKRLEKTKENLKESKDVLQANKDSLLEFMTKLGADGTSTSQMVSYMDRLTPIAKLLGNKKFKDATKQDVTRVFAEYRKKGYKQASINKVIQCMKCFWRWLYDLSSQDPAPECVRWLRRENCPNKLRAEDLWTEEDMEKVMKVARSMRDKCILSVLFEAGLRPGELRNLKIKDVVVNGDMIRLYVAGKTERKGGERVVPILRSYQLVRMWLSQHPRVSDPEAWLWTFGKDPMKEITLRYMVRNMAKKANIAKPSHTYILRHTALTRFYKKVPGVANDLAGHAAGSRVVEVYKHLADEDLEDAIRELNGMPKSEVKETTKCHKCSQSLWIGDRICPVCGLAQDDETALKRMNNVEEALDVKAGIKALGKKYPELGELINRLLEKEHIQPNHKIP
jgi:site-specific recombinase XerD